MIVLDALRKQRNLDDDEGDPIAAAVEVEVEGRAQAELLLAHTRRCLIDHRPDLLAWCSVAWYLLFGFRKGSVSEKSTCRSAPKGTSCGRTSLREYDGFSKKPRHSPSKAGLLQKIGGDRAAEHMSHQECNTTLAGDRYRASGIAQFRTIACLFGSGHLKTGNESARRKRSSARSG